MSFQDQVVRKKGNTGPATGLASTVGRLLPPAPLHISRLATELLIEDYFYKTKMAEEPKGLTNEEANACCTEPHESTKDFIFQQTMFRIKDPKASIDFYSRVMGMHLLKKLDFPPMKFSLYFFGYELASDIPADEDERTAWCFSRKAILELTHNWGTETDPEFKGYHNGNSDPRGFGHIGIMVPDVDKACERFESLGVKFVKKPSDGKMRNLAFIQDPDGYWIEILNAGKMGETIKPFL